MRADAECEEVVLEIRLMHARSTTTFEPSGNVEKQSQSSFNMVAKQELRFGNRVLRMGKKLTSYGVQVLCFTAPLVYHI